MSPRFLRSSGTLDRHKKETPSGPFSYSSLGLTLFCPGDFGGVGDGGKSPDGPTRSEQVARPGKSRP